MSNISKLDKIVTEFLKRNSGWLLKKYDYSGVAYVREDGEWVLHIEFEEGKGTLRLRKELFNGFGGIELKVNLSRSIKEGMFFEKGGEKELNIDAVVEILSAYASSIEQIDRIAEIFELEKLLR